MRVALLLLLVAPACAVQSQLNPIRRIVSIMQKMQESLKAETERDAELHAKFMCYCKKGASSVEKEIEKQAAESKAQASAQKGAAAQKEQLKNDIAQHKSDRADANEAVAKAEEMRKKEASEFDAKNGDLKTNIASLGKAITALSKGMGGSFLQAGANTEGLKRAVMSAMSVAETERNTVMAFLASPYGDYQAASGEIVGILKEMKDEMERDLKDAQDEEDKAVQNHKELMEAKHKEIASATKSIESKSVRQGEVAVSAVEGKNNAANAAAEAESNRKFLANLGKHCKDAEADYDTRTKKRNEEILAISQAIKILNDDDALDIFKKTLPSPASPALIQMGSMEAPANVKAYTILQQAAQDAQGSTRLSLLAYSLKTGKVDFGKIIKMIDEMVVNLHKEQKSDSEHKDYCEKEADKNSDDKRETERDIKDLNAQIDDLDTSMKQLKEDLANLEEEMKQTEEAMATATEQRKKENAEFKKEMTELNAAKQILGLAKNRLYKFYNPALYKPPPQRELTEQERVEQNMGADIGTPAPQYVAGTKIPLNLAQHIDIGKAPKQGAYKPESQKSTGVIGLMDMMDKDLDKQMQENEHDEKVAQRDYEEQMSDSKDKLAQNKKTITTKETEHAKARENHQKATSDRRDKNDELMTTNKLIAALHKECDFLLKNFDFRKAARTKEIDGLKNAKAALSGANYS